MELIGGGFTRMHVAFSVHSTSNVTVLLNVYCFLWRKKRIVIYFEFGCIAIFITQHLCIELLLNGILVHLNIIEWDIGPLTFIEMGY